MQFNNHAGSTKSFDYVREHNEAVNRMDVIPPRSPIHVSYEPGETVTVAQHDGTILSLHKLAELYNPNNRAQALGYLQARQARGQVVTGLLYIDPKAGDLHDSLETVDTPLNQLGETAPGARIESAGRDQRGAAIGGLNAGDGLTVGRAHWGMRDRSRWFQPTGSRAPSSATRIRCAT